MHVDESLIVSSLAARDELEKRFRAQTEAMAAIKNRVETLERENADLHRMLDEQTDKALEVLSSSKSQAAKFEDSARQLQEERDKDRAELQTTRALLAATETQMEGMKERLRKYLEEELRECMLEDERDAQMATSAAPGNQSQGPGTVG
jgi:chromosome segregation ATPase